MKYYFAVGIMALVSFSSGAKEARKPSSVTREFSNGATVEKIYVSGDSNRDMNVAQIIDEKNGVVCYSTDKFISCVKFK